MFKVMGVRVVLAEDGTVLAFLGVDVQGPKRVGRFIFTRDGEYQDGAASFWDRGVWIRVSELCGPMHRGAALNADEIHQHEQGVHPEQDPANWKGGR